MVVKPYTASFHIGNIGKDVIAGNLDFTILNILTRINRCR